MPTFETALYATQKPTRANPSRLAVQNGPSSEIQFAIIPHTCTTETTADLINLCVLPAGAVPVPELSGVCCVTDPGTLLTVSVGSAALTTGWISAMALTAPGMVYAAAVGQTMPGWLLPTPLVADSAFVDAGSTKIYATLGTVTALTNPTVIYFVLAYKLAR